MSFTKDKIERIIKICLLKLRKQDKDLLDINVNERTITHKLAEYLQEHFPEFNVDCEYNRFERKDIDNMVKKLDLPTDNISWDDTEAKTVFPDIIVHKRRSPEKNILVIEVKKSLHNISGDLDRNKLIAFTKDPYNYDIGLFLKIDMEDDYDDFEWFSKGVRINE